MPTQVRRVRAGEWRLYRELRLAALRDTPSAFEERYADLLAWPDDSWRERVEDGASGVEESMFVGVLDGRFAAKATCFTEPPGASAQIVGVYVVPHLRGSGVADDLMAAVIRWARDEAGADRLRLFVMRANERAAGFYRRTGFAPTGLTIKGEDEMAYDLRTAPAALH
ncbi:GNAT family N-acetyltransferase [Actinoplanes sp. NPDC000266]